MITFKQYLSEVLTRTHGIDIEALKKWCDQHASKHLSGNKFLFRGGSGIGNSVFMLGDSMSGDPRRSANTSNNYTLWIDNNPMFEGWPKRSRSFICATSFDGAENFGDPHFIIPADDALIGIVGEDDLWQVEIGYDITFESLSDAVNEIFDLFGIIHAEHYVQLKRNMEAVTTDELEVKINAHDRHFLAELMLKAMKGENVNTLFECWEKLVTPKLFERSTGAKIKRNVKGEVWVQGQCMFIPTDGGSVSLADRKEIIRWLEERSYKNFLVALKKRWYGEGEE